jgi:hypothetical protein
LSQMIIILTSGMKEHKAVFQKIHGKDLNIGLDE